YAVNYSQFTEALNKYPPQNLTLMKAEEMHSAIERPAQKLGVQLEDGLTQLILKDVKQEPGNLPLLEFALTQLWAKQSRGQLTHQAYSEIGGVAKALSNHAEAVYSKLSEEEQKQAQRIFLQLVRPGEGTEDTRRVATRGEVGEEYWELIQRKDGLADARLVVTGRNEATGAETVEVVHEALIRKWQSLQEWIENDRAFLTWRVHLRMQMKQWISAIKDEGALLRGKPLVIAEDWLQKRDADLSNEREYIEQSLELRKQEQEEQKRRRRFITFGLMGFSVFALSLAGVAGWQWQKSEQQRRTTEVERSSLNALQKVENAPIDALVLAMESGKNLKDIVKDRPTEEYPTVSPLLALQTILDNIYLKIQFYTKQKGINSVIFDENKQQIITAGEDGTVRLLDLNGKEALKINAHQDSVKSKNGVKSVRFLNKNTLVTGGKDGTAKLWDLSSQPPKLLQKFQHCNSQNKTQCGVNNVRTPNRNSEIIATSGDDGRLILWNLQGRKLSEKVQAHQGSIESINFSPDNRLIATAGKDGVAKLWQLNGNQITPTPVATFQGHQGSVYSVFFSYKKDFLATAGEDGIVILWDFNGKQLQKFNADIVSVKAVRVSEDDKLLATASINGTVRLWSLDINNNYKVTPLEEFKGHQGRIESIRFSKDGKTLVSSGADDGMVKIWTVPEKKFIQLKGHEDSIKSVRFSPNGDLIATGGEDGRVIIWDRNGLHLNTFKRDSKKVNSVRFSPDGKSIATGGDDGYVRLWDLNTNKLLKEFNAHQGSIKSVNFSNKDKDKDGELLATGGQDGQVKLWNRNGDLLKTFKSKAEAVENPKAKPKAVESVRFSRDNTRLVAVGEDGMALLWDMDNPEHPKELKRHQGTIYGVSFSSDGKEVFTAGDDGMIRQWDLNGTELPGVKAYQNSVRNISFSRNSNLLATVGAGGTVKLWTSSGQQLAEFLGHQGIVNSAAFSEDGKWLATAGDDHTAIVWRVRNLDELLTEGCDRLKYYLSTHKEQKDKELKDFCDSKEGKNPQKHE
ncbi:MAG TPA: hypothetical protein V6D26_28395, partial [Stenomitos sp.]